MLETSTVDDLLALAADALRVVRRGRPGAAEMYVEESAGVSAGVERGRLSEVEWTRRRGFAFRTVDHGRVGFGTATDLRGLATAVPRARSAAKHRAPLRFRFPGPRPLPPTPWPFDAGILGVEAEDVVGWARELLAGARAAAPGGTVTGGGTGAGMVAHALVNDEGLAVGGTGSLVTAGAEVVIRGRTASRGSASDVALGPRGFASTVGGRAATIAKEGVRPRPLPRKAETVLFDPVAFAELIDDTFLTLIDGDTIERGESTLADRRGERIASPAMDLIDDPWAPGGIGGGPVDDEGVPTRPLPIVEHGVFQGVPYDLETAARFRRSTTGSGFRADYHGAPSIGLSQVRLTGPKTAPVEDLIGMVDRGVLVRDVIGSHTADETTGDFGVTCTGALWIERGEVRFPVRECLISGNGIRLLRDCRRIGTDRRIVPGGTIMDLPSALVGGLRVSG